MKRLALLFALVLAGAAPEGDRKDVLDPPVATLRALHGRVSVLEGKTRTHLTRTSGARRVVGHTLTETGPRARYEVSWRGWGSLRSEGRSSLGFEVRQREGVQPVAHVEVRHLDRLELETRRGWFLVDLPGGWALEFDAAVVHVSQVAQDRLEIVHRGGRALRVHSRLDRGSGWPRRLEAGAKLVLTPPRPARLSD